MLEQMLNLLSKRDSTDIVYNLYSNKKNCDNLRIYLEYLTTFKPNLLMVGEAPGYNGCRLTGIPFTSGHIIRNSNHEFFRNKREKFKIENIVTESTASIFWSSLPLDSPTPLLWNAFPFHPHKKNTPKSNRKPTPEELKEGTEFLMIICDIFKPQRLAGIGRVGEKILRNLFPSIEIFYIRHPSRGGKQRFEKGIQAIFLR